MQRFETDESLTEASIVCSATPEPGHAETIRNRRHYKEVTLTCRMLPVAAEIGEDTKKDGMKGIEEGVAGWLISND